MPADTPLLSILQLSFQCSTLISQSAHLPPQISLEEISSSCKCVNCLFALFCSKNHKCYVHTRHAGIVYITACNRTRCIQSNCIPKSSFHVVCCIFTPQQVVLQLQKQECPTHSLTTALTHPCIRRWVLWPSVAHQESNICILWEYLIYGHWLQHVARKN